MRVKNAFAVRSHRFGEREKALYHYASEFFGKDNTFLVFNSADENLNIPSQYNHIIFNKNKILTSKDLFWPNDCGWKGGDYNYYALNRKIKGYDFIWLGEPDIQICSKNPSDFFEQCNNFKHDFLAAGFGRAREELFFYRTAKTLGESTPMTCIFPLTRLRVNTIPILFDIRKKISKDFIAKRKSPKDYPNDEIFISTVGTQLNLTCAPLQKISSFNFKMFTTSRDESFLEEDIDTISGKFIVHPVLSERDYIDKKVRYFRDLVTNNKPSSHWAKNTLTKTNNPKVKKILSDEFKRSFAGFLDTQIT